MDCSRRRVLECIACASERCNAIDTLCRNHVHNKLTEAPEPAHSRDADVAHSTKNRSDLSDKAMSQRNGFTLKSTGKEDLIEKRRELHLITRACL